MNKLSQYLEIGSSPHVSSGASVDVIMRNVFMALLPVCAFSIYAFGIAAALVLATATLTCVVTEHVICRLNNKPTTIGDWSVAITGLLYGLTLPPDLPLWMVAIGAIFAVA
ncbi:MAG: RnfABCDGE type electron transport complex subunit D, partial [Gammaproteobacteria bacterium]|nr:RnfABCDGE type electron transport complex subunit D [Gammaproteobacteria bacterium]